MEFLQRVESAAFLSDCVSLADKYVLSTEKVAARIRS